MPKIKIKKIAEDNNLEIVANHDCLCHYVLNEQLTIPGVELAGFFDFYEKNRLVLMGSKEVCFLAQLPLEEAKNRLEKLFKLEPPAIVFSKNVVVDDYIIELSKQYKIPLLKSDLRTTALSSQLYNYLQEYLSEVIGVHAVLLDIGGMGTLITGKSGIGKSETALELIKRGHQLIADDRVDIFERATGTLVGRAPNILQKYIEIRGIGIVDVVQMFGIGVFRKSKKIKLVVELEEWDPNKTYDRLGIKTQTIKFFNTTITKIYIPVLPGRNLALLVECAALNEKLKHLGVFSAKTFTNAIDELAMRGNSDDYE